MHVVGIGGTTRAGSSTEKAVRVTLKACEDAGGTTVLFAGPELVAMPFYAPENAERAAEAVRLVDELRRCDAVVLGSSSYHGTISGLVKNALDYTEDMREEGYLQGRPVGCIATGAGWQGVVATLGHLRTVVHSLRGWPTPLGAAINTAQPAFDPDGQPSDEKVAFQLRTIAEELFSFGRG